MRFIGVIILILSFVFSVIIAGGIGGLFGLISLSSIVIAVGSPVGAFFITSGTGFKKAVRCVFTRTGSTTELYLGLKALHTARTATLVNGFVLFFAGVLSMLRYILDKGSMGPGMSVAILGPFWAIIIAYFVLLPLYSNIEDVLRNNDTSFQELDYTVTDLAITAAVFCSTGLPFFLLIYLPH